MESTNKVHDQPSTDVEAQKPTNNENDKVIGDWLKDAVLGVMEGLLSTASPMLGAGAVRKDSKTMILIGIATSVAGACGVAIEKFASTEAKHENVGEVLSLAAAAAVAALAYWLGAVVPLLAAAFAEDYHVRLAAVIAAVSFALLGLGGVGAVLGKLPIVESIIRVLVGGLLAMGVTFGLTKLGGSNGLE